jgi:hypothetical protein
LWPNLHNVKIQYNVLWAFQCLTSLVNLLLDFFLKITHNPKNNTFYQKTSTKLYDKKYISKHSHKKRGYEQIYQGVLKKNLKIFQVVAPILTYQPVIRQSLPSQPVIQHPAEEVVQDQPVIQEETKTVTFRIIINEIVDRLVLHLQFVLLLDVVGQNLNKMESHGVISQLKLNLKISRLFKNL